MLPQPHHELQPAPREVVDTAGNARLGTYSGSFHRVDWSTRLPGIKGLVRKLVRRKRWLWGGIATDEVFTGFAIVDVGYASNAFAFAVDLRRGGLIADHSFLGLPGAGAKVGDRPDAGARCEFNGRGARFRAMRPEGTTSWLVEIDTKNLKLEAVLDTTQAPPPVAVVMRLNEGDTTATQKANLLPASGTLRAGGRRFELAPGFGGFDYTNGILGRRTAWRWAFGMGKAANGTPVGFNLTDGLSMEPGAENVVWVGNELVKVDTARFTFDAKHPEGSWQVRTDDGCLNLRFAGQGMHAERRNLGLVQSRFFQTAGTFTGTVRTAAGELNVEGLPGVTEDQFVVW